MTITSPAFANNQAIPAKYTCDGANVNPPLYFQDIPPNTQSLALIIDDPDSPSGNWIHWLLFNIPPNTRQIPENSTLGQQGINTFGNLGYGGPCPGSGRHRYVFTLYALDTNLTLDKPNKENLLSHIKNHMIIQSNLTGLYHRTNKT